FREVLQKDPNQPEAIESLEALARARGVLRVEAASALEKVFERGGDPRKLAQMLEVQVTAETSPKGRSALLLRIAELHAGPPHDPHVGFLFASRALKEAPDDAAALGLCHTLSDRIHSPEELLALLVDVAPKVVSPIPRAAVYRALARAQAQAGEERPSLAS